MKRRKSPVLKGRYAKGASLGSSGNLGDRQYSAYCSEMGFVPNNDVPQSVFEQFAYKVRAADVRVA